MKTLIALMMLIAAASACGSSERDEAPPPFDVSGYDRSCVTTDECILVYSGDPCGCACQQFPVSSSEQARYSAERNAYIERACPAGPPSCGPCPMAAEVLCVGGQCAVPG